MFHQQWGQLFNEREERESPKKYFISPLQKFLETKRDKIRMISLNASYQFYEEVNVAQELSMPQRYEFSLVDFSMNVRITNFFFSVAIVFLFGIGFQALKMNVVLNLLKLRLLVQIHNRK